jgi:hypothetical protein
MKWVSLLTTFAPYIVAGAGAWIARHLKKPSDLQRATLLATLATDAAAWAVATYPGRAIPELVQIVVRVLTEQSGIPTTNAQAIERAAHSAVADALAPPTHE